MSTGIAPDDVLLARAYLSRVAEPSCIPLWDAVRRHGPLQVAHDLRARSADPELLRATQARADAADPQADLDAAERGGIRLIVPESPDWPHFALSCLEATGLRRAAEYRAGQTKIAQSGEPIPPLALWVRGSADPSPLGVRSVGIVGTRSATRYGEYVTAVIATGLADRGFPIVSGGAYGIDAAAHRAALDAGAMTVLVSAGGLDRAYPPGHADLFERVASTGLLVSESPPGAAPQRRRFLTRNRLIAAFSTGTVVVEAARRSGALNTAGHCFRLGRPVLAVPGSVLSAMSLGTHQLVIDHPEDCRLVTCAADVAAALGDFGRSAGTDDARAQPDRPGSPGDVSARLGQLDDNCRTVYDGFPARRPVTVDELAAATTASPLDVIRALPALELAGLVTAEGGEYRRLGRSGDTR